MSYIISNSSTKTSFIYFLALNNYVSIHYDTYNYIQEDIYEKSTLHEKRSSGIIKLLY